MSKNVWKTGCFILASMPFLSKFPYMVNAWRTSPMDRFDWIFVLWFAGLAGCALVSELRAGRNSSPDWLALPAVILTAGGFLCATTFWDIHALAIGSGILLSWATLWLLWGWPTAWRLLFAYGVLLLCTTSSRYWIGFALRELQFDGLWFKFGLGVILSAGQIAVLFFREYTPKRQLFFFSVVLLLGIVFFLFPVGRPLASDGFQPEFGKRLFEPYLGKSQLVTPADRRFFGNSKVERFLFASDDALLNVLAVSEIVDVHQIHPASHCLSLSGWDILSEKVRNIAPKGKKPFYINEIHIQDQDSFMVVWVWYSSPRRSTGSFFSFRRNWRSGEKWTSYQISVPLESDNLAAGRELLMDFLNKVR